MRRIREAWMGLSARWVLVSYLTIGGAVLVAHLLLAVYGASAEHHVYWAYGLGSLAGGCFAASASQGRTVADAGLGAVLVAATLVAISQWADIARLTAGFDTIGVPLSAAVIALAGGVAGAKLGEASQRWWGHPLDGWWFTAALAALHIIGAWFAFATVGGLVVGRFDSEVGTTLILLPAVSMLAALIASMVGGAVTQAAITEPVTGRVFGSAVVVGGGVIVVAITKGVAVWTSLFLGPLLILGLLFIAGLAALGAKLAYWLDWEPPLEADADGVPAARVIDRG